MPEPVEPVAYRGKMVKKPDERFAGYQPENHEWRDWLCDRDLNGRLVGKDPMTISLDVLTASGHPRTAVRDVNHRLRIMQGIDTGEMRDSSFGASRLTKIREQICMPCSSEQFSEVRRCTIYDCPAWPYRMGHNPHNPQRGIKPTFGKAD
jgi:hypothetical protein